ncbi:PREDICTED: uncharacterized protein LOC106752154 isoform X3 [Dinoponera quadriceps]|uniref:Uncharacterized protein LOC106752154 isoform X3 n=1 Tax=Dinoponera quadriceps TaxID=609295 RepID=A0A6P3YDG5_DINQU|nr:PREDICTED: uncharacterized protein LOC106752154 isoform X3 [Dinoponera quadriceps]
MNNPYRARPTRSRVDHSAAYGIHNQNMWMPMPRPQSDISSSASIQQPSVVNQSKHTNNTWKDPWDWNLDQQSDTQQQQQQHYIPSYPNQGQLISNPVQDHYYKNLNNDVTDLLNQNSVSGRNTPRTESSRQVGPNYTDSFYTNYNQNQQYPLQRRQVATGYEHSQWADEQQQAQNAAAYTAQQRFAPPQKEPPQSSAASHNYSWNKDDSASQHNWQKYTDMLGHAWQDEPVDNANNKCVQMKEHSMLNSRHQTVNEAGNAATSTHQPVQTNNLDESFNSWQSPADWRVAQNDWQATTPFHYVPNIDDEQHESTIPAKPSDVKSTTEENVSENDFPPADELSSNLGQLSINTADESFNIHSSVPDNVLPPAENSYQSGAAKEGNVSQSGYDQWYKQSALENTWYGKDRPPKQWNAEQNVENYENIQQTSDFVNVEVVTTSLQERDIYGSRDSINKETLDNEPKPKEANQRDFREEASNVEVVRPPLEQTPDNYEFASNDRNTFLETGELTDSHQEHEPTPPSQDDENDEVPNDIPFLREVPGQSSSMDPRRNDPTGQEQYGQRLSDPRRNDPSGQEQRRDVPPGQERNADSDALERRNDPSGRERSLPRNDPSGEERSRQITLEPSETRQVPGREPEEAAQQTDAELRQIPGGASPNDVAQTSTDDRTAGRVVTGSQEVVAAMQQDQTSDSRNKREEAVGASQGESVPNRRDSDEDDQSGNSREDSRERRREASPDRRRYEYERKNAYYEREYEDDYYYDRRRDNDFERRDDDRKHSRDDLDRREDVVDRRIRGKEDPDERDGRRRPDDRRRVDDPRRRDPRDYDSRFFRDRDYVDRERRRDDRRSRRYDDYDMRDPYRREYYDDPYGRRPSSRSSYNDRDREYYMRARDPYYAYNGYGGYDYNAHYGNNYYAYLENLRRTNPAAYSEWYHKYYSGQHQQSQHIARGVSNYPEDRASVHSGRSSCDDRTAGDKRTLGDMLEDSAITSARVTPTKFSTSHAYGCFSIGSLVHVHPSYPADGERAKVDIFRIDNLLLYDPVARDLRSYPGPLINGVTHKKTIIEYCESKIKRASEEMVDRASYILLYELMIMLIQQNGNVVGVDIATLLLRNKDAYPYDASKPKSQDVGRRESVISQRSGATGGDGSTQDISTLSDKTETKQRKTIEQITDEFRNTLLYGLVQEALEYAMNEGLWGHALFLASKLDRRTHASVMTRFANSLPPHDPLQTLYQLHSGRVPAIVTCVADPRWDDWRPHLAMIISNTSANPEVNRRSITTLGDTLSARGDIHAAHFCYILAQIDFGAYGTNGVKLVLIGANHNKPYSEFLTTEAVMLTEIYEYARNLSDPCFTLVDLQKFKFDLVVKMVDCGLMEKALLYIEQIATNVANDASNYKRSFIEAVYTLGDRIKYHDPICKDSTEDAANLMWLNKLAEIVGKYQNGEMADNARVDPRANAQNQEIQEMKTQQQNWNTVQSDGPASMMEVSSGGEVKSDWQPLSLPTNIQETYDPQYMRSMDESAQYQQQQQQQQQDYWNQQSYYEGNYGRKESTPSNWQPADQAEIDSAQQQDKWNYEEREEKTPTPEPMQPTISMTPSMSKQYDPLEELDALETPKSATETKKAAEKATEKKAANSGSSWFGGLFSKLAPKPKNQMILPDDSNPTIVWDPVAKKWTNKDEDGDNGAASLAPPPKAADVSFRAPTMERSGPQLLPGAHNEDAAADPPKSVTGSNMYKLPKVRSMRANYVDVMNPGGSKSSTASSNMPTPVTSPLVPMATSSPQLFVPMPINDPTAPVDFLTPAAVAPSGNVAENTPQTKRSDRCGLWNNFNRILGRRVCLFRNRRFRLFLSLKKNRREQIGRISPHRESLDVLI